MRAPAFLALLTLFAAPLAAQDAVEAAIDPATDPRVRVLLLGDSISHGYHKTVVEELGEEFHVVRPMNANGKGYRNCEGTTRGVKELDTWLALDGGHWDVIHFNFGLHDLKHVLPGTLKNSNDPTHPNQAPIDVYERQLREITERLLKTGADVIFATTTPVPDGGVRPFRDPQDVIDYNWVAYELMFELGVQVNWLYDFASARLDQLQQPKNVHFTMQGSIALGKEVAKLIRTHQVASDLKRLRFAGTEPWKWNRRLLQFELKHLISNAKQDVWTELSDPLVSSHDHMLSPDSRARIAQLRMRRWMQSRLAPLRGPLEEDAEVDEPRVEVVRSVARAGYSIEHLLIDSHSGMRIPAHLYLPDESVFAPPYAGVLVPCGHAYEGKAHIPYQIAGAAFARHGMVALVFDPLDQGERIQAPKDDASRQQHWGTTSHNITGAQARLLGWSQAGLEAFDGERCLSALAARPEVDPDRLGICGQSGGGTQTAQLFAVDTRLKAAAPACYITSLPALTDTIGPQDEEQNLYGQAYEGLDHAAYLTVRAPAPILICAAQDDFFSIEGTRATFEEVRAVYREFDAEDKVQMVVSPGGHNWGRELVSATIAFFAKELDGREIDVNWSDAVPMTTEEAQVTPRGQVVWMPGEITVYDVLLAEAARAQQEASDFERSIGNRGRSFPPEVGVAIQDSGSILSHKQLRGSKEWVPELTPGSARAREVWLNSEGLAAVVAADRIDENEEAAPAVAWLVIGAGAGNTPRPAEAPGSVHYFDPICTGDMTPADRAWYGSFGPAGTDGAYSVLTGRSLLGRQVEQILEYGRTMQGRPRLVASGLPALAAAHAYAMTPEIFDPEHSIELPFESWLDLFGYDVERNALAYVVHDALRYYDLSDLLPRAE